MWSSEVEKTKRTVSQKEIRYKQCLKKGVADCAKMMLCVCVCVCVYVCVLKYIFIHCFYGCDRFKSDDYCPY